MKSLFIIVIAISLLSGCAGHSTAQIETKNTVTSVRVGDEVEISMHDRTYVAFTIKAIEDGELIGESVQVPIADIETITLHGQSESESPSDSQNRSWEEHVKDAMAAFEMILYAVAILASL